MIPERGEKNEACPIIAPAHCLERVFRPQSRKPREEGNQVEPNDPFELRKEIWEFEKSKKARVH